MKPDKEQRPKPPPKRSTRAGIVARRAVYSAALRRGKTLRFDKTAARPGAVDVAGAR